MAETRGLSPWSSGVGSGATSWQLDDLPRLVRPKTCHRGLPSSRYRHHRIRNTVGFAPRLLLSPSRKPLTWARGTHCAPPAAQSHLTKHACTVSTFAPPAVKQTRSYVKLIRTLVPAFHSSGRITGMDWTTLVFALAPILGLPRTLGGSSSSARLR